MPPVGNFVGDAWMSTRLTNQVGALLLSFFSIMSKNLDMSGNKICPIHEKGNCVNCVQVRKS